MLWRKRTVLGEEQEEEEDEKDGEKKPSVAGIQSMQTEGETGEPDATGGDRSGCFAEVGSDQCQYDVYVSGNETVVPEDAPVLADDQLAGSSHVKHTLRRRVRRPVTAQPLPSDN